MNKPIQILIGTAIILLLGVGVWYGFAKIRSLSETNSTEPMNTNKANERTVQSDEEYWNSYWNNIVSQARQASAPDQIGEFTFLIPKSLVRKQVETGTVYSFKDVPEGPYISFQVVADKPESIVAEIKNDLSQFERVVAERKETIDGVSWNMIQQTTDFGIDQVTWVAAQTEKTMKVFYTVTRPETTAVFEDIVRSARRSP